MSKNFFFLLCFTLCFNSPLTFAAEPPSKFKVLCATAFKRWVLPHITPDLTLKKNLLASDNEYSPNNPIGLAFDVGRRLGFGMKGAVYVLDDIAGSHPKIDGLRKPGVQFALKTSHQGRFLRSGFKKFQTILIEEQEVYEALMGNLPAIESNKWYPKNPSWKRGTIPIAPILARVETELGAGLVKVVIPGASLKDLQRMFRNGEINDDLYSKMKASLTDWYHLSQAVSETTKIVPSGKTQEEARFITSIDINPENMVWVDDPATLSLLGIESGEPTFAAYELGEPALTNYHHSQLSLEEYEKMWINFVQGSVL